MFGGLALEQRSRASLDNRQHRRHPLDLQGLNQLRGFVNIQGGEQEFPAVFFNQSTQLRGDPLAIDFQDHRNGIG